MSQYQSRGRGNFRRNTNYQSRGRGRNNYNSRNTNQKKESSDSDEQSDDSTGSTTNNSDESTEGTGNESYSNNDYNDNSNNGYEEDEEEDAAAPPPVQPDKDYRSLDHTPARSFINPNYKSKEVHPFIDAYIKYYNENSSYLPEFYSQDASFSLTFKKMPKDSEVALLFEDNRNLFFHPRTQPILGGNNILAFLKAKFSQGSNMTENTRNIQIVSNLFFAVNIYGKINIFNENDTKTVNFAKTLVVIGKNGKLLITNDHLALCM